MQLSNIYKALYQELPHETLDKQKERYEVDREMLNARLVHCQDIMELANKEQVEDPVLILPPDTPQHRRFLEGLYVKGMAVKCIVGLMWYVANGVFDIRGNLRHHDALWYVFLVQKLRSGEWSPWCTSARRIMDYLSDNWHRSPSANPQ